MTRSITHAAVHRPAYRRGDWAAEGPDEDAFTLATAAAEAVLRSASAPSGPVDALHVVGEFPMEADLGLPEVLDVPHLAIGHHRPGLAGLGAALQAAADSPGNGSALVVAADVSRPVDGTSGGSGAAAVAFLLGPGAGLRPVGHGARRHPAHRVPEAAGWVADAIRYSSVPADATSGSMYFLARSAPPVLLAFWRRSHPALPVVPGTLDPEGVGPAPAAAPAMWLLAAAAREADGEWSIVTEVTPDESRFLGLHRTGSVRVLPPRSLGIRAAPPTIPVAALRTVSEGAYLPRARYLEGVAGRWRLEADRCPACRALTFPPRARCRSCGTSEGLTRERLAEPGKVLAATVVSPGAHPTEFDPVVESAGAYGVVLAEFAPGVRATLQVADGAAEPLAPGAEIVTELRRSYPMEAEWRYARKALGTGP